MTPAEFKNIYTPDLYWGFKWIRFDSGVYDIEPQDDMGGRGHSQIAQLNPDLKPEAAGTCWVRRNKLCFESGSNSLRLGWGAREENELCFALGMTRYDKYAD